MTDEPTMRDYPERIWVERDEDTNEKRWFSIKGMGVEYVRAALATPAASPVERKPYDMIVKRLLNPPFGTETSERLLMGTAADAIRTLLDEVARAITAASPARGEDWPHIANEWADTAATGLEWLRNIRDGISTTAEAIENMEADIKRCGELRQAPPAAPPPQEITMTEALSTLELDILRASAGQIVQLPYEKTHEMAEATSRLRSLGLVATGYDDDQPTSWATEAGRTVLTSAQGV